MSLYDEVKFKLHPRDRFRGWKYHAKHDSKLIHDAKDKAVKDRQKKLSHFFK